MPDPHLMTDQAPELLPLIEAVRNEWGSHLCYRDSFFKRLCGLDNDALGCRCRDIAKAVLPFTRPPSERPVAQVREDARRYQRLRILGAAPGESPQLKNGTVLRFTGLDAHVDADMATHPSRGEALTAERPEAAVAWPNGCDKTVPRALRYLAEHDRPTGGQQKFNSEHLYQLADEIEKMAAQPLYAIPHEEPGRETMTSVPGDDGGL